MNKRQMNNIGIKIYIFIAVIVTFLAIYAKIISPRNLNERDLIELRSEIDSIKAEIDSIKAELLILKQK